MKWYIERLGELEGAKPIISICGDDCAVCPRYLARTAEELRETAEFWYRAGWRDRVVSDEEIRCDGCGSRPTCSFMLLPCARDHGVAACRDCAEFECEKVRKTYARSDEKKRQCEAACESPEEFRMLCRAFYEKEINLRGRRALVVIDIQNDITKHYRDVIDNINAAIDWAARQGMAVVYIRHHNLSPGTRTFKPGTRGAELAPELKIASDNIFDKTKANALTSEAFSEFIRQNGIDEFYIAGADATGCVKSTCFNMAKAGYAVHVIADCITSYDLKKIDEMLDYYAKKGCEVAPLAEYQGRG